MLVLYRILHLQFCCIFGPLFFFFTLTGRSVLVALSSFPQYWKTTCTVGKTLTVEEPDPPQRTWTVNMVELCWSCISASWIYIYITRTTKKKELSDHVWQCIHEWNLIWIWFVSPLAQKKLVLGFAEKIFTVDLHQCQDYDSCENCVLAQDPYCSWTKSGCTPADL